MSTRETHNVYILWDLDDDQLERVLLELRRQLDEDYHVIRPMDSSDCIQITLTKDMTPELWSREFRRDPYIPPEYAFEKLCKDNHMFTVVGFGTSLLIPAVDIKTVTERAQECFKSGDFQIDHVANTMVPNVYYACDPERYEVVE